MLDAERVDLRDLPTVEFGAVELERLALGYRRRTERLAVPFGAQIVFLGAGCEVGQKVAAQRAADGDVNGGSVAHGACPFAAG